MTGKGFMGTGIESSKLQTPSSREILNFNLQNWVYGLLLLSIFGAGCKSSSQRAQYSAVDATPAAPTDSQTTTASAPASSSTSPATEDEVLPLDRTHAVVTPKKIDPLWLQPPSDLYTLGPGDRLDIDLIGDPTSRTSTVVGPDGKIYFSFLSGVDVWGATLSQAKALLENEMSKFVREKPQIGLVLRGIESKRIWVLGRVQAPGVYALTAPMTLLEGLSMAGGTMSLANYQDQEAAGVSEELANLDRSFILRNGKLLPVDFARLLKKGDMSQNIYLEPDDFIYLPAATAREVYVLGAVAQPRAVVWTEGLSAAGAVAGAYGTIRGAYMHHVLVIRGSLTQPEVTVVDYKRVIRGQAQDMALQPQDIVYVPFSPYRYLDKYLEIALDTFVSAAAINAGERAVAPKQQFPAGVFIPVGSGINIIPPVNPPPIR